MSCNLNEKSILGRKKKYKGPHLKDAWCISGQRKAGAL